MPPPTTSPTLFITSTLQQQTLMQQGFVDRMIYRLVFKPISLNTFHKTSEYLVKKILCEPFIHLDTNNAIYLNHAIANQGVREIMKRMKGNLMVKGEQNYIENHKLMDSLRVAIRDSRNLNKVSKYQETQDIEKVKKVNLWYMK